MDAWTNLGPHRIPTVTGESRIWRKGGKRKGGGRDAATPRIHPLRWYGP